MTSTDRFPISFRLYLRCSVLSASPIPPTRPGTTDAAIDGLMHELYGLTPNIMRLQVGKPSRTVRPALPKFNGAVQFIE